MKFYVKNKRIFFDYTDVDPEPLLATSEATACRAQLRLGIWSPTGKRRVRFCLGGEPQNMLEARRIKEVLMEINSARGLADSKYIEVDETYKKYCNRIEAILEEFRQEEKRQEEEREKAETWKRLCKRGCKGCETLQQWGDCDFYCAATGDDLQIHNAGHYRGAVYMFFDFVPFPSENCPFNPNKAEVKISG